MFKRVILLIKIKLLFLIRRCNLWRGKMMLQNKYLMHTSTIIYLTSTFKNKNIYSFHYKYNCENLPMYIILSRTKRTKPIKYMLFVWQILLICCYGSRYMNAWHISCLLDILYNIDIKFWTFNEIWKHW